MFLYAQNSLCEVRVLRGKATAHTRKVRQDSWEFSRDTNLLVVVTGART